MKLRNSIPSWWTTCLVLGCLSLVGCGGGPEGEEVAVEEQFSGVDDDGRYHDAVKGFSIVFPEGWEPGEGNSFMSPDLGDEDPFIENMSVVITGSGGKELDVLCNELSEQMKAGAQNHQEDGDRRQMKIDGHDALAMTYTYSDSALGDQKAKAVMYLIKKDDRLGAVVATALESSFDEWKERFDSTANSFKFK